MALPTSVPQRKANALVQQWCEENGGTLLSDQPPLIRFRFQTPYGPWTVSINAPSGRSVTWHVFTRFDEPSLASRSFGCNPHSGKWNFHTYATDLPRYLDEHVFPQFRRVLTAGGPS